MNPARGRGANLRKQVLPNINAAGRTKPTKAEEKPDNAGKATRGRGRGRGRGGDTSRGGGRGGGGGKRSSKNLTYQSEGTFTAGLSEASSRPRQSLAQGGEEAIIGRLEKPVTHGLNGVDKRIKSELDRTVDSLGHKDQTLTERVTYETEWLSDEDEDKIAYYELMKPSIIADIRKARIAPVVVPQKDTDQFDGLLKTSEKTEERKAATLEVEQSKERKAATSGAEQAASEVMRKYINDDSNKLMLLQMPPSALDGQQPGSEVGKLQLLKNGKVRLVIGDRTMDVKPAIASQMFEAVGQVETLPLRPKIEPGQAFTDNQPSTSTNTGNVMKILGNVEDSLLCCTYNAT